jgi:hypothetical protein
MSTRKHIELAHGPDWRMRISMLLTVFWLLLGVVYISKVVGWTDFVSQNAPSLGSFLEGAFAPLAFLWLVVGFFLQQQQLNHNTIAIQQQLEEMRRTGELAEVQARAIAADELHSRQDTFLRVRLVISDQLGMIAGWILTSYVETTEGTRDLWQRTSKGEHGAFSLELVRLCLTGEEQAGELFYGTEIRRGHSERFVRAFERMLESASKCDPNNMIEEALRDGVHGRLYRIIAQADPQRSA